MADFRVVRNGILLGSLTRTGGGMFWSEGEFEPVPDFANVQPLFDEERLLLEADEIDAWEAVWDKLSVGLVLEPLDGSGPITEFLLHIEGRQASWRY